MHEGPKDIWFGGTVKVFGVFIASLLYPGFHRSASSQLLLLLLKSVLGLCALTRAAKCAFCTNCFLCWNNLHAETKKSFLQFMLLNLYHAGVCLYFPFLVTLRTFRRARRSIRDARRRDEGWGAWGTQLRHNKIKLQEERDGAVGPFSWARWGSSLCQPDMTQPPFLLWNRLSCFKYMWLVGVKCYIKTGFVEREKTFNR